MPRCTPCCAMPSWKRANWPAGAAARGSSRVRRKVEPAPGVLSTLMHSVTSGGLAVSFGGSWMDALLAGAIAAPLGAPETVAIGGAVCIAGGVIFEGGHYVRL